MFARTALRSIVRPAIPTARGLTTSTPSRGASLLSLNLAHAKSKAALKSTKPAAPLEAAASDGKLRAFNTSQQVEDGGREEPPSHLDPDRPARMDLHPPPAPGSDFKVVMIGAGNIMFGSDEGPWNHSFRLEHKLGPRLKVVALIDPSIPRAESVLDGKRASFVESAYKDTKTYKTIEDFKAAMTPEDEPHAFVIGCPPKFRGGVTKGNDLEINLLKEFPNSAYFIEKPVSTGDVAVAKEVTQRLINAGNVVSVGYMLRYLRCVQKMKQIIHENDLTVMATIARYACAYEAIAKPAWWDKSIDMGPVIEQGTHFCDISRYFGGDVDIDSVTAHSVEWYEKPGQLSRIPVDESKIPEQERIPRLTSATWKYENGAVGSFTHAVALHGHAYSCELEVYADGYQMKLVDPYNSPTLYVRRPGDDHDERHVFTDDDPFFSEVSNFIDAIEGGPEPHVLSSYEDATKTYELTWAIRKASEASSARRRSVKGNA